MGERDLRSKYPLRPAKQDRLLWSFFCSLTKTPQKQTDSTRFLFLWSRLKRAKLGWGRICEPQFGGNSSIDDLMTFHPSTRRGPSTDLHPYSPLGTDVWKKPRIINLKPHNFSIPLSPLDNSRLRQTTLSRRDSKRSRWVVDYST